MLRVAYVGNFVPEHGTEVMVKAALETNGCQVFPVQQDDAFRAGLTDNVKNNIDLLIYTRTHNRSALHAGWTDVWRKLETNGVVTCSLSLDRYWDLQRERIIHAHDPMFTVQHVWTADGGNDIRWQGAGVNHHWLIPAVDGRAIRDEMFEVRDAPEILFVGSTGGYHSEYPQREQLVQHLARTYGDRFKHFGRGGVQTVRGPALTTLYRSAKVVVGDSCFANDDPSGSPRRRSMNYWSDRIPETLGRGGFLIHPWVPGLSSQFDTGRHLVTHVPGDWEDLDAQIGQYLASPGQRVGIAQTGREHVLRRHTWDVRMREVLDTMGFAADRAEHEPVV